MPSPYNNPIPVALESLLTDIFRQYEGTEEQANAWLAVSSQLHAGNPELFIPRVTGLECALLEVKRLQQCASELAELSLAKGKADADGGASSDSPLQSQLAIALQSLTAMACFNDSGANASLKFTGDYSCFDEPSSVRASRAALLQIEALGQGYLPVTIASTTKGTSELDDLLQSLVKWRYCMSYNDSYFGEPSGELKRIVAQIDRLLSTTTLKGSSE